MWPSKPKETQSKINYRCCMGSPLWKMSCKTWLPAGIPEERPHGQVHGHRWVRGHPRPLRRRGVHQQSWIVQVCLPAGNGGDREARMSRSRWVWGRESHLSSWEVKSYLSTQHKRLTRQIIPSSPDVSIPTRVSIAFASLDSSRPRIGRAVWTEDKGHALHQSPETDSAEARCPFRCNIYKAARFGKHQRGSSV